MRIRSFFLFRKYAISSIILLLLLFTLILMSLRVKQQKGLDFFDSLFIELCSPLHKVSKFITGSVHEFFRGYVFLIQLQKENTMLQKRITELQRENQQLREYVLASERLKGLLQFKDTISTKAIVGEVIGHDPSGWFKSITINKGEREGVRSRMAVITNGGVVGQVIKTSSHHSVVLLITDYNSAIDAVIQRSRAKTIVEGTGENRCQLKYLLRNEDVAVGDIVVTSGIGGNFPKGLLVGQIRKVEKQGHGIFQYAELSPAIDLTRLEEVLIILEPPLLLEDETRKLRKGK